MAVNTSIQRLARNVRTVDVGEFSIDDKPLIPIAQIGDTIVLLTFGFGGRLYGSHLHTLAATPATLQLQINRGGTIFNITAQSTPNQDSRVTGTGLIPMDILPGDILQLAVSGAATLGTNIVEYDLLLRRA